MGDNSQVRSMLVPHILAEQHRLTIQSAIGEPDVLVLHPTDRLTLFREINHQYPWQAPTNPAENAYEQFNGMDIVTTDKMMPGYFVVGRRVPIERVVIHSEEPKVVIKGK